MAAKRIYSDDKDLGKFSTKLGIEVVRTSDLPLPAAKQIDLVYEGEADKN
jgi:hypothetical protein